MNIRQEQKNDYAAVYNVVKTAFETAEKSDGNEAELVDKLRKSNSYFPQLSLAYVGEHVVLALAPLSVLPKYQRKGIGFALIREGHQIAKKMGLDYSVVLGHPSYYPKLGYAPASIYGIKAPFDVPDENFMAVKLNDRAKYIEGVIKYDKAFGTD